MIAPCAFQSGAGARVVSSAQLSSFVKVLVFGALTLMHRPRRRVGGRQGGRPRGGDPRPPLLRRPHPKSVLASGGSPRQPPSQPHPRETTLTRVRTRFSSPPAPPSAQRAGARATLGPDPRRRTGFRGCGHLAAEARELAREVAGDEGALGSAALWDSQRHDRRSGSGSLLGGGNVARKLGNRVAEIFLCVFLSGKKKKNEIRVLNRCNRTQDSVVEGRRDNMKNWTGGARAL